MFNTYRIERKLDLLIKQGNKIMSDLTDLQASLDAINAEVPVVAAGVTSIETTLTNLQNSTTSTLSQADAAALAASIADAATIKSSLDSINSTLPVASAQAAAVKTA